MPSIVSSIAFAKTEEFMGTTSTIKSLLFDDTEHFSQLLEPAAAQLTRDYPDPAFTSLFSSLPHRSITVGPMAMCKKLVTDLGGDVDDSILRALGILCFHISTHDDLVDEPPASQSQKAALLYAGNISFIVGMQEFAQHLPPQKIAFVSTEIARNHALQQQCIDELWTRQPSHFSDYAKGVQHDGALIGIGVCTALAVVNRGDLWPQLKPICTDYGIALQLLDDISEVEEDAAAGYCSYPVVEGWPYTTSFTEVERHASKAMKALNPEWRNFRKLLENINTVKETLQETILS
jgi:hypothetical protein